MYLIRTSILTNRNLLTKIEARSFANSSTQVLESAKRRGEGVDKVSTRMGSILPIREVVCSNWQNRGGGGAKKGKTRWWMAGKRWGGKTEVVGSWTRVGRLGFANSSTCVLEFAEPRWRWRQEGEDAVVGGQTRAGTLSFANSSTRVLEFAEPRWVDGRPRVGFAKPKWWVVGQEQEGSVLLIRALACSNLQNRGGWVVSQEQGGSVLPIRALACSNLQNRGEGWLVKSRNARFC